MSSKQEKALYSKIMDLLDKQSKPENNPAQNALTSSALERADYLKKGDFSSLPKGNFFNFQMPSELRQNQMNTTNIAEGNTFTDDGTGANNIAGNNNRDAFARAVIQNKQDNIDDATAKINSSLNQAAGYKANNDQAIIKGLQNMMGRSPQGFNWGGVLSAGIGAATQAALAVPDWWEARKTKLNSQKLVNSRLEILQ